MPKSHVKKYAEIIGDAGHLSEHVRHSLCSDLIRASTIEHVAYIYEVGPEGVP